MCQEVDNGLRHLHDRQLWMGCFGIAICSFKNMAALQTLRPRRVPSLPHLSSLFHYVDIRQQQITRLIWLGKTGWRGGHTVSNDLVVYSRMYSLSNKCVIVQRIQITFTYKHYMPHTHRQHLQFFWVFKSITAVSLGNPAHPMWRLIWTFST